MTDDYSLALKKHRSRLPTEGFRMKLFYILQDENIFKKMTDEVLRPHQINISRTTPSGKVKKWKPSKLRRFDRRKTLDWTNQMSQFGRFHKMLTGAVWHPTLMEDDTYEVLTKNSKQRRNAKIRENLSSGRVLSLPDINVLSSHYKMRYKDFPKGKVLWVTNDQFLVVTPGSRLYAGFSPSGERPHPKAREYLQEMIAKRKLPVQVVDDLNNFYRTKTVLVEQQDLVINDILDHKYQSLKFNSIADLVGEKRVDTKKLLRLDKIASGRQTKRAGKNRPSKQKRARLFKTLGIERLRIESTRKRKSLETLPKLVKKKRYIT